MADAALLPNYNDLMGSEVLSFDPASETITMRFVAPQCFITGRGGVQGGLVAGFLDEVMGRAHVEATKGAEAPLNLEIAMTLMKLIPEGPLLAKGRVIRRGRRAIFLEGELFDAAGTTLYARATSTAIPTPVPRAV
ncbi:acyl-coenzyme A thioesterase PaaI-like protein [Novosphingobium kunmingense]|uniref:Acyl-coenzyme A thioesterase PaaI-like protein n=1 Tax=Novosphingobium kunmingense TaxID=1211806 RepID=A0A2N0H344_9SPHN|nr:PaaI family thioesterase [Novosphingobium kunmingense]PKB13339.1 acyl-coenzyme A thioesterase PaaI-like protein [Novosphingobium kunmingense]